MQVFGGKVELQSISFSGSHAKMVGNILYYWLEECGCVLVGVSLCETISLEDIF